MTSLDKLGDGTYLMCPKCGSEDPSEKSEAKAIAGDTVKCRDCGEEYKASYDEANERFVVQVRTWTRSRK